MTFKLHNRSEFGMFVSGVDMKIGADLLQSITIIENAQMSVPSVQLTFVDDKKSANSFGAFTDGAQIAIELGDGKVDPVKYDFKQWSIKDAYPSAAGQVINLTAMADLVPWFRKTVDKSYKGTASDAIQQIASKAGLLTDLISTNDKMVWLPDNRSLAQFARKIADHSWIADGASAFLAVTSQNGKWQARLKDIMKQESASKRFASIGLDRPADFRIWDYRINSTTGMRSATSSHGMKVIQEQLDGKMNLLSQFQFSQGVNSIGINSGLANLVGTAMAKFMAPDIGNTHKEYAKAKHHNIRAQNTFSTNISIQLDELTNTKLLDDVEVALALHDGSIDEAFSGTYKVQAIARHISKGSYTEKLSLTSQGTGTSLNDGKGGDAGASSSGGNS